MMVANEVLVDPGPLPNIKARYINDLLNELYVNTKYVPEPACDRCAVVATRNIKPGEGLFVSYGEAYWANQGYEGTVNSGKGIK
jgi:SET domain-containing protein